MQYLHRLTTFVVIIFSLTLFSCGGCSSGSSSSSSGDVTALALSNQVSLVQAKESSSSSSISAAFSRLSLGLNEQGVDWLADESEYYVSDSSLEALDFVNELMCSLDQTHHYDFLNEGSYIAMVDIDKCEKDKDHSGDSSNQSSTQSPSLEGWVVDVTRESDDDPQIVKIWINIDDDEDFFERIHARVIIEEGASDENPYGIFTAYFQGLDSDDNTVMEGVLDVSETDVGFHSLKMKMEEADGAFAMYANAVLTPGEDSGVAFAKEVFSFDGEFDDEGEGADLAMSGEDSSLVAFDADHFLSRTTTVDGGTVDACLDRNNFEELAFSYTLYDEGGLRKNLNGGFGIKDATGEYGWAGYYGIWFPSEVGVVDGDVFTSDDGGSSYEARIGSGRFIERTRQTITLAEIEGDIFHYWDDTEGTVFGVIYENGSLKKISQEQCTEFDCQFVEIAEQEIPIEPNQWFGMWRESFGNLDIRIPEDGLLPATLEVPYYIEEDVKPTDFASSLSLKCYYDCPKGGLTVEDLNNNEPFIDDGAEEDEFEYTFDPTTYTLSNEDGEVTIADGAVIESTSNFSWGIRSGPMITESIENRWEIWDQEVVYVWETGPEQWNKQTALIDSDGVAVAFDRPLQCQYRDAEYGMVFLHYEGRENLWGIPWVKMEDTDVDWEAWKPLFSIPNGSEIDCEGTTYYSKAQVIEQSMTKVDLADCSALSLPDLGLPDIEFVDPDIGEVPTEGADGAALEVKVSSGVVQE